MAESDEESGALPPPAANSDPTSGAASEGGDEIGGRYAQYVLAVLVVVYVLNFLDRQIISVLAEQIKADLDIDDAQIGFLYGTAFAVFYAIFGIPLGRLADVWSRRSLIAVGLAVWSTMTSLSGFARNFTQLAVARIGVGIGEASATPAAFSMLSDSFPAKRRATALAIYSSGIYIGGGLGLFLGGVISSGWNGAFPVDPPLGLKGWQAAYLAVGLPGIAVAFWVRSLREPQRGQAHDNAIAASPHPLRVFATELRAVLPLLSLVHFAIHRAPLSMYVTNIAAAGAIAATAFGLIRATGDTEQWCSLGIGIHAAFSWVQSLRLKSPETFQIIFRTKTLQRCSLGFACLAFSGYALGFWATPYAIRSFGVSAAEVGGWLGASGALGGFLGVTLGGLLADRIRQTRRSGRLYVGLINAVLPVPLALWMYTTDSYLLFLILSLPTNIAGSLWIGPGAATVQDLVPPQMRATASATYLLVITFIGLALGPYVVGRLSVATGSLQTAILYALCIHAVAFVLIIAATRSFAADEDTTLGR